MGVFTRFKRGAEGFRALVELWETTASSRRARMIEIGMSEDPEFTQRALECLMTFEDIRGLPDEELAEVMAKAPPRITAFALHDADPSDRDRFIRCAMLRVGAEIRDCLEIEIGPRETEAAKLKLVATARELERKGLVRIKRIPT